MQDDEISLFALGTTLLRNRWRIARWMGIGAVLAGLTVITKPALYRGAASFVPQGSDGSRAGLAGLAGQFGISLPAGGGQSTSPEFYTKLLTSRVVLLPIVRDTFTVRELGGKRVPFLDLFEVPEKSRDWREDQGIKLLQRMVDVSSDKPTGVLEVSVATEWRGVSLALVRALLAGVNEYNARTRQGQAAVERQFLEGRLATAGADLRAAENRLQDFLQTNRNIGNSPELTMERDRLQRALNFRQDVFTTLSQSYDDARIREVRDTPVITIFEPPAVPAEPEPRGRLKRVALGVLLGTFVGVLSVVVSTLLSHGRAAGDANAEEFVRTLRELRFWRRGRERSGPVRIAAEL